MNRSLFLLIPTLRCLLLLLVPFSSLMGQVTLALQPPPPHPDVSQLAAHTSPAPTSPSAVHFHAAFVDSNLLSSPPASLLPPISPIFAFSPAQFTPKKVKVKLNIHHFPLGLMLARIHCHSGKMKINMPFKK